jgi:hypothetical protein
MLQTKRQEIPQKPSFPKRFSIKGNKRKRGSSAAFVQSIEQKY